MRIAVTSDIHSNIEALTAVLADAERDAPLDGVWATGDLVGYGADPGPVLAALRARGVTAVAGNHDLAATGGMDTDDFNAQAAAAAHWTAGALSPDEADWIRTLPLVLTVGDFTLVHGSIRDPAWEYLLDARQAEEQFARQTTRYSVVGHSHLPFWFEEDGDGRAWPQRAAAGRRLDLGASRLIINPGSVGQPRDGDARASYVLYDDRAAVLEWRRVAYDIAAAQRKIIDAGLPRFLAERLSVGR